MFRRIRVIIHMQMVHKLLVILLGTGLCSCAEDLDCPSDDEPDLTGLEAQILSIAESVNSEYQDATELDVYLMSMVEDVQSLAYALRLVDPAVSENNKFLKEVIVDMLDLKLLSLTQFLSNTEDDRVIGSACRALEQATDDVFISTNSCSETLLCERSHDLAQVCVTEGFATKEDIAIPQDE